VPTARPEAVDDPGSAPRRARRVLDTLSADPLSDISSTRPGPRTRRPPAVTDPATTRPPRAPRVAADPRRIRRHR